VLGKVEVLLSHEYTLCTSQTSQLSFLPAIGLGPPTRISLHIPRKRYSWIFLRSSLGISLDSYQQTCPINSSSRGNPYIVASSWCSSGNRSDNAKRLVEIMMGVERRTAELKVRRFLFRWL
jgi:hypothetical protein